MVTPLEIALRAEVMATAAQTRISSHEAECSRRYGEVADRFSGLEEILDRMREDSFRRYRMQITAFITILGSIGGQILLKLLHII